LRAGQGQSNSRIACRLGKDRKTVQLWRARWVAAAPQLAAAEEEAYTRRQWEALLREILSDAPRSGAPSKYSAEQLTQILAVACEHPARSGRPITHWTPRELAAEVIQRGIVTTISPRTVGRWLALADIKPHRSRYWLTSAERIKDPERFANEVRRICALYLSTPALHKLGVHIISIDEKTGIQALERKYPPLPLAPGYVERREFEYTRHGTQCLTANFEIATGQCLAPTIQDTRTEDDFVQHVA
jgi:transposase